MLHFDEPMSYTSVDVGGVFLLSAPTESAGAIVQLTAGSGATATTVRATNNRDIELQLSAHDMAALAAAGIGRQGRT